MISFDILFGLFEGKNQDIGQKIATKIETKPPRDQYRNLKWIVAKDDVKRGEILNGTVFKNHWWFRFRQIPSARSLSIPFRSEPKDWIGTDSVYIRWEKQWDQIKDRRLIRRKKIDSVPSIRFESQLKVQILLNCSSLVVTSALDPREGTIGNPCQVKTYLSYPQY